MGSWVHAMLGYGIQIPDEEVEGYTPSQWMIENGYAEADDEYTVNWYEALEVVTETDPNLSFDTGYVHDYYGGGAVFYGEVLHTFETVKAFDTRGQESSSHANVALAQVAEKLGVPFKPSYILVVSYG